jgi:hypothetical protein
LAAQLRSDRQASARRPKPRTVWWEIVEMF